MHSTRRYGSGDDGRFEVARMEGDDERQESDKHGVPASQVEPGGLAVAMASDYRSLRAIALEAGEDPGRYHVAEEREGSADRGEGKSGVPADQAP